MKCARVNSSTSVAQIMFDHWKLLTFYCHTQIRPVYFIEEAIQFDFYINLFYSILTAIV